MTLMERRRGMMGGKKRPGNGFVIAEALPAPSGYDGSFAVPAYDTFDFTASWPKWGFNIHTQLQEPVYINVGDIIRFTCVGKSGNQLVQSRFRFKVGNAYVTQQSRIWISTGEKWTATSNYNGELSLIDMEFNQDLTTDLTMKLSLSVNETKIF